MWEMQTKMTARTLTDLWLLIKKNSFDFKGTFQDKFLSVSVKVLVGTDGGGRHNYEKTSLILSLCGNWKGLLLNCCAQFENWKVMPFFTHRLKRYPNQNRLAKVPNSYKMSSSSAELLMLLQRKGAIMYIWRVLAFKKSDAHYPTNAGCNGEKVVYLEKWLSQPSDSTSDILKVLMATWRKLFFSKIMTS